MSIAVSAVVRPSLGLRLLHGGFCVGVMLSAGCCAGPVGALLCVLAGLSGLLLLRRGTTLYAIDISGVGQLRLTVYQQAGDGVAAEPVRLLAGSTLWPGLLLLRLGRGDGRVATLAVLPDCVAPAAWRALALACRASAARTAAAANKNQTP